MSEDITFWRYKQFTRQILPSEEIALDEASEAAFNRQFRLPASPGIMPLPEYLYIDKELEKFEPIPVYEPARPDPWF